ncbi:C6 transcription factor [Aspergillus luchuensis]|uniref:C6 transcription factor n=1 Tax=Aspergillus kawachii TaxID=1069201 RepID=A0A146EY20_ASPKA|nr:C6 transcription factor [Aspergillus luchuensis]
MTMIRPLPHALRRLTNQQRDRLARMTTPGLLEAQQTSSLCFTLPLICFGRSCDRTKSFVFAQRGKSLALGRRWLAAVSGQTHAAAQSIAAVTLAPTRS